MFSTWFEETVISSITSFNSYFMENCWCMFKLLYLPLEYNADPNAVNCTALAGPQLWCGPQLGRGVCYLLFPSHPRGRVSQARRPRPILSPRCAPRTGLVQADADPKPASTPHRWRTAPLVPWVRLLLKDALKHIFRESVSWALMLLLIDKISSSNILFR